MKDTGWKKMLMSGPGGLVRIVDDIIVPDEEFPIKIRLDIFDLSGSYKDGAEGAKTPFRSHAKIDGRELFRLYAPTMEEAKRQTEEGLVKFAEQLLSAFKK